MSTAIAQWGNSSAVRIPSKVLAQSGLSVGNLVDPVINSRGNIELVASKPRHRAMKAPGRTSSEDLYRLFPIGDGVEDTPAWPNDDMVGAEWESWAN